jgi:hypothetical protein
MRVVCSCARREIPFINVCAAKPIVWRTVSRRRSHPQIPHPRRCWLSCCLAPRFFVVGAPSFPCASCASWAPAVWYMILCLWSYEPSAVVEVCSGIVAQSVGRALGCRGVWAAMEGRASSVMDVLLVFRSERLLRCFRASGDVSHEASDISGGCVLMTSA